MAAIQNKRWLVVLFFISLGLLLAAFIYAAVVGPRGYQQRSFKQRYGLGKSQRPQAAPADQERCQLFLNRKLPVGKILLTYRGMEDKRIKIDVIIPALDPKATYLHEVRIKDARQGIRLGGERFKLVSAAKSKIQLERIP
jgi:hypothetical protein